LSIAGSNLEEPRSIVSDVRHRGAVILTTARSSERRAIAV
jgi:hypothetical protein